MGKKRTLSLTLKNAEDGQTVLNHLSRDLEGWERDLTNRLIGHTTARSPPVTLRHGQPRGYCIYFGESVPKES